jgi:hypothetical protein
LPASDEPDVDTICWVAAEPADVSELVAAASGRVVPAVALAVFC